MIKTENGKDTLSYEEFEQSILNFNKHTHKDDIKNIYKLLINDYAICSVNPAPDYEVEVLQRYIEKKDRNNIKPLRVELDYDCGPYDFHPQDFPSEILILNTKTNHLISLYYFLKNIRENKN